MELPENYIQRMKKQLGNEFEDYLQALDEAPVHGLQCNTLKTSPEHFSAVFPRHITPVPWSVSGFYYSGEEKITKHPYFDAGLFYMQEPAAQLPASVLPVKPGDRVLDLCAAPGGKSLTLAGKLNGKGLLVANDISVSRARVLLRNLERYGMDRAIVTAESPEHLSARFEEYFDAVLADVPCSGEGMFRKDRALIKAYQNKGPEDYVPLQKQILHEAGKMLRKGGYLVYSTCTFAPEEDEEVIADFLADHADFEVSDILMYDGFVSCTYGVKLYPHRVKGEGHYVCLLHRKGENAAHEEEKETVFARDGITVSAYGSELEKFKDRLCLVPHTDRDLHGLRILRSGLLLGSVKKDRFEPAQALAMAVHVKCVQELDLRADDILTAKYLRGETLPADGLKKGPVLVKCGGFALGFGKVSGTVLKNRIDPTWIRK